MRNAECGMAGRASMTDAYICAALRTPVGKHGGALAQGRADDLAAVPIKAVVERTGVGPPAIDDVILGCTNQAGGEKPARAPGARPPPAPPPPALRGTA